MMIRRQRPVEPRPPNRPERPIQPYPTQFTTLADVPLDEPKDPPDSEPHVMPTYPDEDDREVLVPAFVDPETGDTFGPYHRALSGYDAPEDAYPYNRPLPTPENAVEVPQELLELPEGVHRFIWIDVHEFACDEHDFECEAMSHHETGEPCEVCWPDDPRLEGRRITDEISADPQEAEKLRESIRQADAGLARPLVREVPRDPTPGGPSPHRIPDHGIEGVTQEEVDEFLEMVRGPRIEVVGTGPGGGITVEDVERALWPEDEEYPG